MVNKYSELLRWCVIGLGIIFIGSSCHRDKEVAYKKLTAEEKRSADHALLGLETRSELQTTLFAAEEMLVNPTNMDIDSQGRIWITEGFNYRPTANPENQTKEEGDRILILEDTDGDGKADTSKVFYQGHDINAALGIHVLDNKVIISNSPHIFIFTDTDKDDKADKKVVLFTGIQGEHSDHGVHSFVFGPDGKLYFNFGNAGEVIKDTNEQIINDTFSREVRADGNPYRQGMVFRCNIDGSDFEVLAHNFRNNYEVTIDSYGTLWQSDNDDDGYRGVRINYVMEYGNYGYTDELTGAGWRTRRTGMAEDIPTQHWHQNDPGVVPNLLQTGAGAPSGITFYEGELLPEPFQNQIIHTDAGPNIVRAYRVTKDGAGYKATIENILEGARDQWFRPVDVTVAPDGSIFVADWYDPGMGGHQMGDQKRGRVFRIAPKGVDYMLPEFNLSMPEGAVEALKNPNFSIRAKAWLKLHNWGTDAETALVKLWESDNQRYRARALWLLSKLDKEGLSYIDQALDDDNPDIRITGLRAARQLDINIIPYIERLVQDPAPEVRREAAIALHRNDTPEAAILWAELASQHDGKDRWYLEALGIGAADQWERFFNEWLEKVGPDWNTQAGRDIVWRSRADKALPMLTELIKDSSIDTDQKLRYFRAFDFHKTSDKQQYMISLLDESHPQQQMITTYTLKHLNGSEYKKSSKVKRALERALQWSKGSYEFVDLVDKYQLNNENEELINIMLANPDNSLGVSAARLTLQQGGKEKIGRILNGNNQDNQISTIRALGQVGNPHSLDFLQSVILDESKENLIRIEAVNAMGAVLAGENKLVELIKSEMIPASLEQVIAEVLSDSWRGKIRRIAQQYLVGENKSQKTPLPPISELVSMEGDIESGRKIFEQSCQICHVVNEEGTQFGPALSEIGNKLPKDGLYEAIIQPNSGISFGYEGYILRLNDGSRVAGIVQSETELVLELVTPGGYSTTYRKSEIRSKNEMEHSLMPEGLESNMTQQELIDLVEYLSSLKGK